MSNYQNQYFTIVARSSGNVIKKAHSGTFYYSLDSGSTWTQGTNEGAIAVNAGDKVMFKGNLTPNTSSEPAFGRTVAVPARKIKSPAS